MKKENTFPQYQQILKWWSSIRWFIVVILFFIVMLRLHVMQTSLISVFIIVFLGIVFLNLFFRIQIAAQNSFFCIFQVILDIIFATVIVHITGGMESPFVWIYLIAVITASLTIEKTGGVLAGLIGSSSFCPKHLFHQPQ